MAKSVSMYSHIGSTLSIKGTFQIGKSGGLIGLGETLDDFILIRIGFT